MSDIIIGIDLGTTNSEVAIIENGEVTILTDQGNPMLASVVGLSETGEVLVGMPAKNQFVLHPDRTIKSVKRLMGEDTQVQMGENRYTPQEISAILLKTLKSRAEEHLGQRVDKAVITIPAYFSDSQRQATREAGEIAGLEVVRMINEPTAAALAYEADKKSEKTALVYDLGGGTFDVSVVSVQQSVVEVLASHGNNHLGGDDFDRKIVEYIKDHLHRDGADINDDKKALARIHRAAEQAKIALSDRPYITIKEEFIAQANGQPLHLNIELTRETYEELISPYIDETFSAVQTALEGAGITPDNIDEIVLVGGATRTPIIAKKLKEIFKKQPHGEVNPDLCVAMGAAIQAATISGESFSTVLVDVTPYTFGVNALEERESDGVLYPYVYAPIIEKNSPLPVSKSELFSTSMPCQTTVELNIYQGEDPDALKNIPIGQFTIEGLSEVEEANPIMVTFSLDINGILKVTALEKNTGLQKTITIDNAFSALDEDGIDDAKARIESLINITHDSDNVSIVDEFEDEGEGHSVGNKQQNESKNNVLAQALIEKAERLLDGANADDSEDLVDHIEAVKDALSGASSGALETAIQGLTDLVYYLEV